MTIWCMRIACWIPKATNTHSECVTLIAFPLQHCLQKRASILRCIYIVVLFIHCPIALMGLGLLHEVRRSHTFRYTTLGRTSLDEWSARHWDLSLTTDTNVPSDIRTRNPSKRPGVDLHLRQPSHRDRHYFAIWRTKNSFIVLYLPLRHDGRENTLVICKKRSRASTVKIISICTIRLVSVVCNFPVLLTVFP
jgi:hypothetical protein